MIGRENHITTNTGNQGYMYAWLARIRQRKMLPAISVCQRNALHISFSRNMGIQYQRKRRNAASEKNKSMFRLGTFVAVSCGPSLSVF